jgi:hypothetical protein
MQLKPCLLILSNIDVKLWSRWMGARRVAMKASALWKLERLAQEDVIVMMRVINFSEGLLMAARPFLRVVYARSIVASFWGVDRRTNAPLPIHSQMYPAACCTSAQAAGLFVLSPSPPRTPRPTHFVTHLNFTCGDSCPGILSC